MRLSSTWNGPRAVWQAHVRFPGDGTAVAPPYECAFHAEFVRVIDEPPPPPPPWPSLSYLPPVFD